MRVACQALHRSQLLGERSEVAGGKATAHHVQKPSHGTAKTISSEVAKLAQCTAGAKLDLAVRALPEAGISRLGGRSQTCLDRCRSLPKAAHQRNRGAEETGLPID